MGLGGPAADDERIGQTFDLETGALTDIAVPPFEAGREVEVERAAFGAATVVVGAFAYGVGIDPDEVDITTGMPPSNLITYRLDPATGSWTDLALPPEYAQTSRLALKSLDVVGSDGAVALLDGGISQEAVLATLDGDGWVVTGEDGFTDPFDSSYCATATTFWQLERTNGGERLVPISLDDGSVLPVTVPDALGDREWELSDIGCTADALVLMTSNPDERPAVHVTTDGATWVERADPFGPGDGYLSIGPVYQPSSGEDGVVAYVGGMEGPVTTHIVTTDGEVVALGPDEGFLAWRGRTAEYLATPPVEPGQLDEESVALSVVALP